MKVWRIFLVAAIVISLVCGAAFAAAPSVKRSRNTFEIKEGVTDEIMTQVAAEMAKVKQEELGFELKKITDEDLAKLCAAYPNMVAIKIDDSPALASFTSLASLKGLKKLTLDRTGVADFTPLAALTELLEIDVGGDALTTPDLKWMSGMTKLTKISISAPYLKTRPLISLEGIPSLPGLKSIEIRGAAADLTPLVNALPALEKVLLISGVFHDLSPLVKLENLKELSLASSEVKDFSPLTGNLKLQKIFIGGTKGADHSTLGKLTQVTEIQSSNVLEDISWVTNLPNLKKFYSFNEQISDYSAITKINLEDLTIRNNRTHVNLTTLSGAASIKIMWLSNINKISGFEALGTLINLGALKIEFMKEVEVDLSFLSSLGELKKLDLEDNDLRNFDAVAACAKLETVDLRKARGVTSLAALKKLPALKTVEVTKGSFPDAELSGFAEGVKVNQR